MARLPCKDYVKGTCSTPFCEKWHPPECLFYMSERGCKFGDKCSYAHRQVDVQPCKKSKKNGDRIAVALLKNTRQLGCVFQDMEPPKSSSILRKSSTYRNRSNVFDSPKQSCILPTFETPNCRSDIFAQVILISATPMHPNLRIGLKKRDGKARAICP